MGRGSRAKHARVAKGDWRFRGSAARVFDAGDSTLLTAGARRTTAGAAVLPKTKMGPWCRSSTVTLVARAARTVGRQNMQNYKTNPIAKIKLITQMQQLAPISASKSTKKQTQFVSLKPQRDAGPNWGERESHIAPQTHDRHAGHDTKNDATPLGLGENWKRLPRVAHGAQSWAGGRNPVGIVRWTPNSQLPTSGF